MNQIYKSYIFLEKETFDQLKSCLNKTDFDKQIILVDNNTYLNCLPKVEHLFAEKEIIEIPSGEAHKDINTLKYIWRSLLEKGASRKSLIINLGGGVVSDIGGFAAASYMRGLHFINVPTTLLSMVDAAVGSKTGIDFAGIKNLVGHFHQPDGVFIHTGFLKTLSKRELRSGFAEMLKHGLIYDAKHFNDLETAFLKSQGKIDEIPNLDELIQTSINIKNSIVEQDPNETKLRKILNFGHSVGHGIEACFLNEKEPLLHGEAIAIGMICEAFLSHKYNKLPLNELDRITTLLLHIYKKVDLNNIPSTLIIEKIKNDKKNTNNHLLFSLLEDIGKCNFDVVVTDTDVFKALSYYNKL